jgi:hypothetical protein
VRSVEGGLRFGGTAHDWVAGAISLSYARWSNIQADYIDQGGLPSTANIGDGRIISLSNSLRIQPRADVRFEFSSTLNDGRVTDPATTFLVLIGQTGLLPGAPTTGYATASHLGRIPNVARFTARTAIHYDTQLREEWTLSAEGSARYVGRSRLGAGPILGGAQGNYVETDTSLRLSMPAMTVSIGVSNLLDAVGNRFALGTPFAIGSNQITPLRPRTVRIGLERAF